MSDERAVAIIHDQPMELSVVDVKNQVAKLQGLMKDLMKDGEHYGVIPGTNKPSLYKAGAEKIGFIFRLVPEFEVSRDDLPNAHREYQVKCILRHATTGTMVGQGVGSCSTMESKYRWRNQSVTEEVGFVSKTYWDTPKEDPKARAEVIVKEFGPGKYQTKKKDGQWVVLRVTGDGDKVENPDIADQYNTVLKMAKKRAYVDATITATAASDFFTQDIEDFQHEPEMRQASPEPRRQETSSSRKEVIDFLTQHKDELTEDQQKELTPLLTAARDDKALLDAVKQKAKEFIDKNVGWDSGPEPKF